MSIQILNHVDMHLNDYKLMIETAYFLGYLGRYAEAESVFNAILAMTPECESALIGLGNIFTMRGQFLTAKSLFESNINRHPSSMIGHFYLAELLLGMGQIDRGTALLEKVSEMDNVGPIGKMSRQLQKLVHYGLFQSL